MNFKKNSIFNSSTLFALIAGLIFPLIFFSKWFGFLGWICFIPLLISIKNCKPRKSFILGTAAGTLTNCIAFYWLVGTLTRFGGLPVPVSVIFIFVFCLYSGLQFGIFTFLISKLGLLHKSSLLNALLIALLWALLEFFYPVLFPFGLANSQGYYTSTIQVVDILGLNFLSFLIVYINVSVYYLLTRQVVQPSHKITGLLIIIFIISYGQYRINQIESITGDSEKISVGIVQANFDFFEKNINNEFFITERHQVMSMEMEDADLIIWPETAVQHWFPADGKVYKLDTERKVAPEMEGTYFLIGGLSYRMKEIREGEEYRAFYIKHNSAFLTDSESNVLGYYNKIKLLMFGEYFPQINGKLRFIKKIIPAVGDLTPGNELNILEVKEKNLRIGTLICYEDIIPYFGREFSKKGANILINLTNDAWFGRSLAPYQHMLVSIPRAVETRKYLLRSTNSGVSAIISPTGKIEKQTGIFTRENLEGEVALIEANETLYTRLGDIFPWISLLIIVLYYFGGYLIRKYNV